MEFDINESAETPFCEALQMLVNEHENILRLLDLAQNIIDKDELTPDLLDKLSDIIFYVKNYADKYHHAKEENILFEKGQPVQTIINVMLAEHERSREYIRAAVSAIESGNQPQVKQFIGDYINLLQQHIDKENNILYRFFEKMLTDEDKNEMLHAFEDANKKQDADLENNLLKLLDENNV